MEQALMKQIQEKRDLQLFLRFNPVWYRYLSRDPERIKEMDGLMHSRTK